MRIGMDFGTTNSGIAHYDGARLQLLPLAPDSENPQVVRSALYLGRDRHNAFGRAAIDRYYQQNLNRPVQLERVHVGEIELTFAELPTFLRDVYIERDVLSPGRLFLSFKSSLASENFVGTAVGDEFFLLEDIIGLYLFMLRRQAERALHAELREVVLGRPVRYATAREDDDRAQQRMLQAAFLAGFQRVHFAYEPVAAAYDYFLKSGGGQTALIFDFGGGTLDLSVLRQEGGATSPRVLATGGINIAGDAFDSSIVRQRLARHFGEGSHYQSDGRLLPLPGHYYDAFADWQELLALNAPARQSELSRFAYSAERPREVQALSRLISGNYGLRLFDLAEGAKRRLSHHERAGLRMDEGGIRLKEHLTRARFERFIRPDLRQISARLDEVLADAALQPSQIDAVIRTGGSSQIPCFVELLAERFGAEKLRAIDSFSSVTAGLAIIAQRLDTGALASDALVATDLTPQTNPPPTYLQEGISAAIPPVNLRRLQRLLDLRATGRGKGSPAASGKNALVDPADQRWLIGRGKEGQLDCAALPEPLPGRLPLAETVVAAGLWPPCLVLRGAARLLLLTNHYRLQLREAGWLRDVRSLDERLEEFERYRRDEFGAEVVRALQPWSALAGAQRWLLLTTTATGRVLPAKALREKLAIGADAWPFGEGEERPAHGEPFALLPLPARGALVLLSEDGLLKRFPLGDDLPTRMPGWPSDERLVGALTLTSDEEPAILRLAFADGRLPRLSSEDIAHRARRFHGGAVTLIREDARAPLFALTTQRLETLTEGIEHLELRSEAGERLLSLIPA